MQARLLGFGSIEVAGRRYDHDVVVERGVVRARSKKPSKRYRARYGHTPLSVEEDLPWGPPRLVIGTGVDGALPVMDEVFAEGRRRGIEVLAVPTAQACEALTDVPAGAVAAVLHVTC
jgi:hypothetical protein